jgi:hypothetical protein
MTTGEPADDTGTAIVDGINVDAVARAVRAVPGVSDLAGGRFGDATSYLPGRRLTGVAVRDDAVRISVRARWGVAASDLLGRITLALRHIVPDRRIDVVIAEIDNPPWLAGQEPVALPAGYDSSILAGAHTPSPEAHAAARSDDPPTPPRTAVQLPPLI